MNQFNKKVMIASIILAFGASGHALANPTNTTGYVEKATLKAEVESENKGLGNAAASENSTSTVGDITKTFNDNDAKTITKTYNDNDTKTITKSDNDVITKSDNDTLDANFSAGKAKDYSAAVGRDGNATTSKDSNDNYNYIDAKGNSAVVGRDGNATTNYTDNTQKPEDSNNGYSDAKAYDHAAAASVGRDGTANSTNTYDSHDAKAEKGSVAAQGDANKSEAYAYDKASAVGRDVGGNVTNHSNNQDNDQKAKAEGHGNAAATGGGSASATNHENKVFGYGNATANIGDATANNAANYGTGNAASNTGNATADYKVNTSYLSGYVTGQGANPQGDSAVAVNVAVPIGNHIADSFSNNAGIVQTVQNSGTGSLAQQQVSFQGNVNVNPQ